MARVESGVAPVKLWGRGKRWMIGVASGLADLTRDGKVRETVSVVAGKSGRMLVVPWNPIAKNADELPGNEPLDGTTLPPRFTMSKSPARPHEDRWGKCQSTLPQRVHIGTID